MRPIRDPIYQIPECGNACPLWNLGRLKSAGLAAAASGLPWGAVVRTIAAEGQAPAAGAAAAKLFDFKRVAPGTVMSVSPDGLLNHNATTLGGNSGSIVMDMATGQAVALHFGGFEGDRNMAVQAPVVADRLAAHT